MTLPIYEAVSSKETAQMNTAALREHFLLESLIDADTVRLAYTHYDRMIVGGVKPVNKRVELGNYDNLKSAFFLERREIGIINVGGTGRVYADDKVFEVNKLGCVYVGKGIGKVLFESTNADRPAVFFLLSAPAHQSYPTTHFTKEDASPVTLGSSETCNNRTIYKYIHNEGIKSCQLVMGLTVLASGSIWNTMPAHVHDRRMEAYFYFDVQEGHTVFHFMGKPQETRHLLVHNHQAILSPSWSIHSGAGTASYSFIWGMAGENKDFTDMDGVAISDLR
jgi:4-deoxy-L-threo-5-hexosulose-uronate ketol-isomerase